MWISCTECGFVFKVKITDPSMTCMKCGKDNYDYAIEEYVQKVM